jgi:endonuclease/exonuclease/phosphatase (EEP) superfamily protein YafD
MIPLLLTVTQLAVIGILLLSVAGFFGAYHRYLELTAHFKPHYLVVSFLCLCICVTLQAWAWALWASAALALNLVIIAPWYLPPLHTPPAQPSLDIKVMCANVQYTNTNYAPFLRLIHEEMPHVVIAQETNEPWLAHLSELTAQFPYAVTIPGKGGSGIGLYSRLPIAHAEVIYLGQQRRPGIIARLSLGTSVLSLVTIHPRAPLHNRAFGDRNEQLLAATKVVETVPLPKLLIGDFNTSPWSPYYERVVRDTNLRDARKGFGLLPTWPADLPWVGVPIDHCLVSSELAVVRMRTGPHIGSDHFPLIIDLRVPGSDLSNLTQTGHEGCTTTPLQSSAKGRAGREPGADRSPL